MRAKERGRKRESVREYRPLLERELEKRKRGRGKEGEG